MSDPRDDLLELIASWPGWRLRRTRKGYQAYPPDRSHRPIGIHLTESDHRAMSNTLARLRRAGAPLAP